MRAVQGEVLGHGVAVTDQMVLVEGTGPRSWSMVRRIEASPLRP
jgi:hypothetical protein